MHHASQDPKLFNFEYALLSNEAINLTKKDLAKLDQIRAGTLTHDCQVLNYHFSFKKPKDFLPLREKVGTVMRGGYSQIRGRGIAIAVLDKDKVPERRCVLLMKNVQSRSYIPVIFQLK